MRTLRSRGLGFRSVMFKHVLRNAAGPALAVLGVLFVGLLGGAIIVENVFAIPGLGQVSVLSTSQGDIPIVLGVVMVTVALVVSSTSSSTCCRAGSTRRCVSDDRTQSDDGSERGDSRRNRRSPRSAREGRCSAGCSRARPASASMIILTLIALAAIFAPLLAPSDPNVASIADVLGPAAAGHPLGFDSSGRDVLSRLLYGARFSLAGRVARASAIALARRAGGLIAGYYGRWFDNVSSWVIGLLMALPGIVVLLATRAAVGPSMWTAMAVFGVLMSPAFFRLVYTLVRGVREELYVDAARVSGLSRRPDHRAAHPHRGPRAGDHPVGASCWASRMAIQVRPGLPRAWATSPSHLGQHAQRRLRQHLHEPRARAVAGARRSPSRCICLILLANATARRAGTQRATAQPAPQARGGPGGRRQGRRDRAPRRRAVRGAPRRGAARGNGSRGGLRPARRT